MITNKIICLTRGLNTTSLPVLLKRQFPAFAIFNHNYATKNNLKNNENLKSSDVGQRLKSKKLFRKPKIDGEILFGVHSVCSALKQNKRTFYRLFFRKDEDNPFQDENRETISRLSIEKKIPILDADKLTLDYLANLNVHQGVCLDVSPISPEPFTFNELAEHNGEPKLYLFINKIGDPMNLGGILRSAHYFNVDKVILNNSSRLSPVVSKKSAGALEEMTIYHAPCSKTFLETMKHKGWNILGTDTPRNNPTAKDLFDYKLQKPTVVVLGNEHSGISEDLHSIFDEWISIIPDVQNDGNVDSLNVSAVNSILLHHLTKSRK